MAAQTKMLPTKMADSVWPLIRFEEATSKFVMGIEWAAIQSRMRA